MTSLSQEKLFHIVKLVSLKWGQPQLPIFLLQFLVDDSGHEGWQYSDEEECVGGLQEYYWVPAVQETVFCGEMKGVCTGNEGACVCDGRERSLSEGWVVMGGRGAGVRDE